MGTFTPDRHLGRRFGLFPLLLLVACTSEGPVQTDSPLVDAQVDVIDASHEPDAAAEAETVMPDAPPDVTEEPSASDVVEEPPADSPDASECVPGSFRCMVNVLERCSFDGSQWTVYRRCTTAALCDAQAGHCIQTVCLPDERRCVGAELEKCNETFTGWVEEKTCASPAHCRADWKTCTATPCQAGAYQCNDAALQVCNETQTDWTDVEQCATSTLCDSETPACTPPTCDAGSFRCDGNTLLTCNEASTDWTPLVECSPSANCDALEGECDLCEALSFKCDGAELLQCGSSGQTYELRDTCTNPIRCNANAGRCDPACGGGDGANEACGNHQDCCARNQVPGGDFLRSYDGADYSNPDYPATVSSFELDVFEVTVGRFREFVEAGFGTQSKPPSAGDGAHPAIDDSGWNSAWNPLLPADTDAFAKALNCDLTFQTWSDDPSTNERKPINCVTWYEAFAYCAWSGARLPTEAEWNFAAAGGEEQHIYPWGNDDLSPKHAVYNCEGDGVSGCTRDDILPVGSRPLGAARWGHQDMSGSMWEWLLDRYVEPYPMPCVDCAFLSVDGSGRVRRGGSWDEKNAYLVTASARQSASPVHRIPYLGFRCARSLP